MKDKEIVLNYIDKLYNSLHIVGKSIHNYIKWDCFICFVLIFLLIGEIKPINKITVIGLEFEFSLTLLMIALSCIISWMLVQIVGLLDREVELRDAILKLYNTDLFFEDDTMKDKKTNTLEYPSYLTIPFRNRIYGKSKISCAYFYAMTLLASIIIFIVPLIIQFFVFIKLYKSIGLTWWIILIYSILLIISSLGTFRFYKNIFSN